MIRIGVIGAGGISGIHLENLKKIEGVEIGALADISEKALQSRQELFGGNTYTDYNQMLEEEDLQGVLICTPPDVRLEPIEACVAKGIPLFIEKPPTLDLDTGHRIEELLRNADIPHFVGFVFRWAESVNAALEKIGDRPIYGIQSHYFCDMMFPEARSSISPVYYDKSRSGGIIGDQGIHILDLIRYLVGSETDSVSAVGNNILQPKTDEIDTEETVAVQLQMKCGTVADHLHTWAYPKWDVELRLFGKGIDFNFRLLENFVEGTVDGVEFRFEQEENLHFPEMRDFIEMVRTDNRSLVRSDFEDALETLSMVKAVEQSLLTGEKVVIDEM